MDESYETYALFFCWDEDRTLIGGLETYEDPADDTRVYCNHCGEEASELDGSVTVNVEYTTTMFGAKLPITRAKKKEVS